MLIAQNTDPFQSARAGRIDTHSRVNRVLHGSHRGKNVEAREEPRTGREAWQRFSAVAPLEEGSALPDPAFKTVNRNQQVAIEEGEISHHGEMELKKPLAFLADASVPVTAAPIQTQLVLPWQQADKKWFMQLIPLATSAVGFAVGANAAYNADPEERISRALGAGLPWVVGATALVDGIVQLLPVDKRAASQNFRLASSNRLWEAAPSLAVGATSVGLGLVGRLARPSEATARQLTNGQLALAAVYLLQTAVHSIQLWTTSGALKRKTAIASTTRRIITMIALFGVIILVARRDCVSRSMSGMSSVFSQ